MDRWLLLNVNGAAGSCDYGVGCPPRCYHRLSHHSRMRSRIAEPYKQNSVPISLMLCNIDVQCRHRTIVLFFVPERPSRSVTLFQQRRSFCQSHSLYESLLPLTKLTLRADPLLISNHTLAKGTLLSPLLFPF
jgi:hypothetical protein